MQHSHFGMEIRDTTKDHVFRKLIHFLFKYNLEALLYESKIGEVNFLNNIHRRVSINVSLNLRYIAFAFRSTFQCLICYSRQ